MQKVIRRTIFAEKQAARRLARRKAKDERVWASENRKDIGRLRGDEVKQLEAARTARREDFFLGPLAPRRDVGDGKETYGTVTQSQLRLSEIPKSKRDEVLKSVGGKFLNIVKGDRVVLLEGRDKGKIGKITDVDRSRASCKVEGLNMVDVAVPEWMQKMEQSDVPVRSMEAPVPLASVRLVYPLTDTETGETRDVIVKKLVNTAFFHSKALGRAFWKRMIPGLNVVVPWPKLPEAEKKDHDCDTLRLDVETRTFVPTLLRPPMPESIIDELRNKYSKFRTRHDPEYIEAKMQEDREAEEQKKRIAEMRTPLKDVHRRERKLKKAKGKGKLTPEMLEHLGKTIAQNKQLVVDRAASSTSSIEGATLAA